MTWSSLNCQKLHTLDNNCQSFSINSCLEMAGLFYRSTLYRSKMYDNKYT
jgi:hypothetical protein